MVLNLQLIGQFPISNHNYLLRGNHSAKPQPSASGIMDKRDKIGGISFGSALILTNTFKTSFSLVRSAQESYRKGRGEGETAYKKLLPRITTALENGE